MIQVYWDNLAKTIIRLDYFDPIQSWDEHVKAVDESYGMARSQPHSVTIIYNSGSVSMPPGNAFAYMRRSIKATPENVKHIVMVIANPLVRRILEIAIRISLDKNSSIHHNFTHTIDSAYKILKK